jgi:hypothetical protein
VKHPLILSREHRVRVNEIMGQSKIFVHMMGEVEYRGSYITNSFVMRLPKQMLEG